MKGSAVEERPFMAAYRELLCTGFSPLGLPEPVSLR